MGKTSSAKGRVVAVCSVDTGKDGASKRLRSRLKRLADDRGYSLKVVKCTCGKRCDTHPQIEETPKLTWVRRFGADGAGDVLEHLGMPVDAGEAPTARPSNKRAKPKGG